MRAYRNNGELKFFGAPAVVALDGDARSKLTTKYDCPPNLLPEFVPWCGV